MCYTVAVTFVVWGATVTLAHFLFLLHNFIDRRCFINVFLNNLSMRFFPFPNKSRTFTFSLGGRLYSFSLAYPSCHYHYSCALRLFLSKINVTWTQALQYQDSGFDPRQQVTATGWLTGRLCRTKGWFTSRLGQKG